jgi:hypothetical protein
MAASSEQRLSVSVARFFRILNWARAAVLTIRVFLHFCENDHDAMTRLGHY